MKGYSCLGVLIIIGLMGFFIWEHHQIRKAEKVKYGFGRQLGDPTVWLNGVGQSK